MHQGLCVKLGKAFKVEYLNSESCRNTKEWTEGIVYWTGTFRDGSYRKQAALTSYYLQLTMPWFPQQNLGNDSKETSPPSKWPEIFSSITEIYNVLHAQGSLLSYYSNVVLPMQHENMNFLMILPSQIWVLRRFLIKGKKPHNLKDIVHSTALVLLSHSSFPKAHAFSQHHTEGISMAVL